MKRLCCVLLLLLAGCDSWSGSSTPRVVQPRLDETELLQQDDLNLGLEFLNQVYEPGRYYVSPDQDPTGPPDIDRLAMYHLNQWMAREAKKDTDWKPPTKPPIPVKAQTIQPVQDLERARFTVDDLNFLHGRIWQRDVGRRAIKEPLPEPWATWIKESLTPALPEDERETTPQQLAAVLQLFDWTIRNIQLDAFPPTEEDTPAGADSTEDKNARPPQRGVPGPGYQRYPYETMLYGHGDVYERMRVFIELCRQQGIEAVILGFEELKGVRPWAVAVLVGSQAYLFDAELGLPLPTEGGGVITYAALRKQPELLSRLDLDQKRKYWFKPENLDSEGLKHLRVLISASPEELSKRMRLLDRGSTGAKHLALSVDSDALNDRLAKSSLKGIQASLWGVPFDCWLYVSLGQGLRLRRDEAFAAAYDVETFGLRFPSQMLRQARQLQFTGSFDTTEEAQTRRRGQQRELQARGISSSSLPPPRDGGAIELYLLTRPEEQSIEQLVYSKQWQERLGLTMLPRDPKQREAFLKTMAARAQRLRDDTSYWIGIVQYEKGDYANAIKWLEKSLPQESAEKPWADGARYNLARCYEALGQTEEAIKLYENDDSPQRYGNRLRAKGLK